MILKNAPTMTPNDIGIGYNEDLNFYMNANYINVSIGCIYKCNHSISTVLNLYSFWLIYWHFNCNFDNKIDICKRLWWKSFYSHLGTSRLHFREILVDDLGVEYQVNYYAMPSPRSQKGMYRHHLIWYILFRRRPLCIGWRRMIK